MTENLALRENPNPKKTSISFLMRSDVLLPSQITEELGIEPSWACAKGEAYERQSFCPRTRKHHTVVRKGSSGIWAVDSEDSIQSTSVERHALYLLERLEPRASVIRRYVENPDYYVRFNIWWESEIGHGGFDLSGATVGRMSVLCQYFGVGYLYVGPSGEEEE